MSAAYPQRRNGDANVSAQDLGCMGMSFECTSYGGYDDEESTKALTEAADLGITFWDTSDVYGPHTNEKAYREVVQGHWRLAGERKREVSRQVSRQVSRNSHADGVCLWRSADGSHTVRGNKEWVHRACNESLQRLGIEQIDLYYQHGVDDKVPMEETMQAMVELKRQGKIRYVGLSECSAATVRRAHKMHPIAAAQMEFSRFALEIESQQPEFTEDGQRARRQDCGIFSEAKFGPNLQLVAKLGAMAGRKGCTPGQLSLAWILAQGDDFIPIPGTKRVK